MIETKITEGTAVGETRRRSTRDSLLLSATIRRSRDPVGEQAIVRVRNLSSVGLMADYQDVAVPGDEVVVTVRGIGAVAGKVAWLKRGRIGITFDQEVDPIKARRPVVKQAPPSVRQRPL